MQHSEIFELRNTDPDDLDGVLLKIEKSFGFKFGANELEETKTFGEFCDIVAKNVPSDDLNDCTTQQAFYKLREAIAGTLHIDKKNLVPATDLQKLLPKPIRRQAVKDIERHLNIHTDILRPKQAIIDALLVLFIASFIGLFLFWQAAILGLAISITGMAFAFSLSNELDLLTIRQLAEKLAREHYLQSRRTSTTANKNEIVQKVKELFMADLALEEHQLGRQASFV